MLERFVQKFTFLWIAPLVYHLGEDSFIFQPLAPGYGIWISTGTVISFIVIALFLLHLKNSAASSIREESKGDSNTNTLPSQDKFNNFSKDTSEDNRASGDDLNKKR